MARTYTIPNGVLRLAMATQGAGKAQQIIEYYKKHGCVPYWAKKDYTNIMFDEAKTACFRGVPPTGKPHAFA